MTKVSLFVFGLCLTLAAIHQGRSQNTAAPQNIQQANLSVGIGFMRWLSRGAWAGEGEGGGEEVGDSTCSGIGEAAWTKVRSAGTTYSHGALVFFNTMFGMLNAGFPSETESALCHFNKSMSMNPDKGALPVTISKTFGAKTIVLEVVVPTESFATAAGYDAKGTVTVNGTTFMVLYWGGTEDASKGFMIRGSDGIGGDSQKKSSNYIRWDRTGEAQVVDFWGARFDSAYLESFTGSSGGSDQGKGRVFYGHTEYNSTSKDVLTYAIEIGPKRDGSSAYGCYRIWANGDFSGGTEMVIAKTDDAHNLTGESVSATYKDGTNMDAAQIKNLSTTANGTGNLSAGQFTSIVVPLIAANPFDKSCSDINNGATTGSPFEGSVVDFDASPDDVF